MFLTGNLKTMPLPDVLQSLGTARKSGLLVVESGTVRKTVALKAGRIAYCSAGSVKEHLGQHVLARTKITERQLGEAFRIQAESGEPLGAILVAMGVCTERSLDVLLRGKVEDTLYELLTWRTGRFEFRECEPLPADCPVDLDIGAQEAVMEGARRADELSEIRAVLPHARVRFLVHGDRFPPGFPSTGGDAKLVELARAGLTAEQVCPRFHASDFQILRRLAELVGQGMFEVEAPFAPQSRTEGAVAALKRAVELLDDGHHLEALSALRAGAEAYPDAPEFGDCLGALDRTLRKRLDLAAVPVLEARLEQLERAQLSAQQAYVASRINGTWSLRVIAQVCPFEEIEVLAMVDDLVSRDLARLVEPALAKG